MSNNLGVTKPSDPLSQGNAARRARIGKDACPYPLGSRDREAWLEGYESHLRESEPTKRPR